MAYTIEDARPEIARLLGNIGATNISILKDQEVSPHVCQRTLVATYQGQNLAVICFPIVLRTQAAGKKVPMQRYIDFNSSSWEEIIKYWKKACVQGTKVMLLGIRHDDEVIGNYIFSVEGDLSLFDGKSVYIHADHLRDIGEEIEINIYNIPNEHSGKLAVFKTEILEKYVNTYENHFSSRSVIDAIKDFVIALDEENISVVEHSSSTEGKKLYYYTTKYERKASNRNAAIEIHGTKCFGCGFDFEEHYGQRGAGYIEIHHIKPLSEIDEEIEVNPETDLIPLCSNCHRMVHRVKTDVLTLEELRKIITEER